jgi:hypothetical protein
MRLPWIDAASDRFISASELESLTGLTDRRHRQLAIEGFFPKPRLSKYLREETIHGLFRYYRERSEKDLLTKSRKELLDEGISLIGQSTRQGIYLAPGWGAGLSVSRVFFIRVFQNAFRMSFPRVSWENLIPSFRQGLAWSFPVISKPGWNEKHSTAGYCHWLATCTPPGHTAVAHNAGHHRRGNRTRWESGDGLHFPRPSYSTACADLWRQHC